MTEQQAPEAPAPRPVAELADAITAAAVRLSAATATWLRMIAEFDERRGWAVSGVRSCAHWLAWQCGLAPGAAREHVRVARALTTLPLIDEALGLGRVSYSTVRALTRVAEPATEAELLELARHATASQVERIVRGWRRADAPDGGRVAAARAFTTHWDADGMLCLQVRMAAEEGAALLAAVGSLVERASRRERAAATRAARAADRRAGRAAAPADRAPADRAADGPDTVGEALPGERLTELRCAALAQLAGAAADAGRRAGDPPRREVVVHVDAGVLADDAAAGRAHLEGGPPLHPAQVRRMLCEATVVGMVERDTEVLAMGRRRRYATPAQRRALMARDGGCARPGCTETRVERLHAHHLRHWLHGGRTDVSNMVLLCDVDHGLAHEQELVMTRRGGRLEVTDRDGCPVWTRSDPAFDGGLDAVLATDATEGDPRRGGGGDAVVLPLRRPQSGRPTDRDLDLALGALAPAGLPGALPPTGERAADLGHVVWALLAHRDFLRRQAA